MMDPSLVSKQDLLLKASHNEKELINRIPSL
jgi:hypothetical protein